MAAVNPPPAPPSKRAVKAAETRRRMLDAAIRCFAAGGYTDTTMAAIADEAGVAVQTLYFTFRTKPELLQAAFDRAVLGDGPPVPPPQSAWFASMRSARPLPAAIGHLVRGVSELLERVAPLRPVFQGAVGAPGVAEVWAEGERLRAEGYRDIIGILRDKRPLRRGVDADTAVDVLLVLLGPDLFRSFTVDRAWPRERWERWVAGVIERELFAPAPTRR